MANSDVDRLKNCSNRVAPNYACFNFTKQYVYTTFFLFLWVFWFLRLKNIHFHLGFARFLGISGPRAHHYFSRYRSRSNTDGPLDRKCPKNGQNAAEMDIFRPQESKLTKTKKSSIYNCLLYIFMKIMKNIQQYISR